MVTNPPDVYMYTEGRVGCYDLDHVDDMKRQHSLFEFTLIPQRTEKRRKENSDIDSDLGDRDISA